MVRNLRRMPLFLLALLLCCACGRGLPANYFDDSPRSQRIVTLAPSLTETVYDLGAGNNLVAATNNDNYPPEVAKLPKVGNMYPDLELLAAARPDLVLAEKNFTPQDAITRMGSLKFNLLVLEMQTIADLRSSLPQLGQALHAEEKAKELCDSYDKQMAEFQANAQDLKKHPTVFLEVWSSPLMTAGQGSLLGDIAERAGAINIYADEKQAYPVISAEDLLMRDPDILILTGTKPEDAAKSPGLRGLKAVKQNHMLFVDPDLLQRPTMRCLEGINIIQQYIMQQEGTL